MNAVWTFSEVSNRFWVLLSELGGLYAELELCSEDFAKVMLFLCENLKKVLIA